MAGTKIYIVTTGTYSAYRIYGVFSKEALARRCVAHLRRVDKLRGDCGGGYCSDAEYKEWDLDEAVMPPSGMVPYEVRMTRYGKSDVIAQVELEPDHPDPYTNEDHRGSWFFYMYARSAEHAVKIANERRAELIASNRWVKCLSCDGLGYEEQPSSGHSQRCSVCHGSGSPGLDDSVHPYDRVRV